VSRIVEHSTGIDAPPDIVWKVTTDLERWPEWTPTVRSVRRLDEGPVRIGAASILSQPGMPRARWVVTRFEPGTLFEWESNGALMKFTGTHTITSREGGTVNSLRLEIGGALGGVLFMLAGGRLLESLQRENAGLKARCESIAAGQAPHPVLR
jgi:uncharacterized membrane protein